MIKRLLFFFLLLVPSFLPAQEISKRIIFFGNAGKETSWREAILSDAANKILPEKTEVVYLGNSLFPKGFSIKNPKKSESELKVLYERFTDRGTSVHFLPGNREWGNNNSKGAVRMKALAALFDTLPDPHANLLPENAYPGPVTLNVDETTLLVVLDSEWGLYDFDKKKGEKQCSVQTEDAVLDSLAGILQKNLDKNILLLTHHPFVSQGKYGGKTSIKDHLFPLTQVHPSLYLPLPGAGSLATLFKKTFPTQEYVKNADYQALIRRISELFTGFPNAHLISSHENGLQFIKDSLLPFPQMVVGMAEKNPLLKGDEQTLFETSTPGYLLLDILAGGQLRFSFYGMTKEKGTEKLYEYHQGKKEKALWDSPVYTPLQEDSVYKAAKPDYNAVGKGQRKLLGENYRKAWATPVKLPVFKLSKMYGGLEYRKMGGGYQTVNMRLKDSTGDQYVLRSVAKTVNRVIPEPFETPFTRHLVGDFFSSQHPYSALIVPPIAEAVGVPHADPQIGVVSPDPVLGKQAYRMANEIFLIEPWEPLQPTDNYQKALKKLKKKNKHRFDGLNFLNARMVDLLIGDWDRDEDQWRFHDTLRGPGKHYLLVPRDRDIVLNVTEGSALSFGKKFLLSPRIYGFNFSVPKEVNWYLYNSRFLNEEPDFQIGYEAWMKEAEAFTQKVSDSVLEAAVNRMPKELDQEKKKEIYERLRIRRDQVPEAMDKYYGFINKIVDIHGSDRKEFVKISGLENEDALHIIMRKISKKGKLEDTLMDKTYPRSRTKEIRIYLEKDFDSVVVDNSTSTIKLRIIGGKPRKGSHKSYRIIDSKRKIRIYDYQAENYLGKTKALKKKISKEPENTQFVPVDLYHVQDDMHPDEKKESKKGRLLFDTWFNKDDGLGLQIGKEFVQYSGFRKQKQIAHHTAVLGYTTIGENPSFEYEGHWFHTLENLDLLVQADLKTPRHSANFFGLGNENAYKETGLSYKFFHLFFNQYGIRTALQWEKGNHRISLGPALQLYHFHDKKGENDFLKSDLFPPDLKPEVQKDKSYLGLDLQYEWDQRDDLTLTTRGVHLTTSFKVFSGLNSAAHSVVDFEPTFSFYQPLNAKHSLILSDRIGGKILGGRPAFYQMAYLGGEGTMLGYRQLRFAGDKSIYNNLVLRLVLSDFANQIFRGQIGLTGFYDAGRVWFKEESSHTWHHNFGGGVYLAPAYLTVIHFNMAYSPEDKWYPYLSFGFRF